MNTLVKEMNEFGYTTENLYTMENRIQKQAAKVFNQTLYQPKYSYPENEIEHGVVVFVTKEVANMLPEGFVLKRTYDDARYVYACEQDAFDDTKQPLFKTMGSGYDERTIPHIIFQDELKGA